jgi:hypothetical protein
MRFDIENQVSVAQAFTGVATVSTHSIDTQDADADPTIGRRLALLVLPTVAQGAGSTMTVEAIQADDAALTTNVEALGSVQVAAANMQLGDELEVPFPQGTKTRRYLGARVTLTGGTTTITADIYLMPQDEIAKYKSFPKVVDAEV